MSNLREEIEKQLWCHNPPLKTQAAVNKRRADMIKGNYPASMTDCEVVGISGHCGKECPVFMRKECEYQTEIAER